MHTWGVALQNVSDGDRKGSITTRHIVWFPPPLRVARTVRIGLWLLRSVLGGYTSRETRSRARQMPPLGDVLLCGRRTRVLSVRRG